MIIKKTTLKNKSSQIFFSWCIAERDNIGVKFINVLTIIQNRPKNFIHSAKLKQKYFEILFSIIVLCQLLAQCHIPVGGVNLLNIFFHMENSINR